MKKEPESLFSQKSIFSFSPLFSKQLIFCSNSHINQPEVKRRAFVTHLRILEYGCTLIGAYVSPSLDWPEVWGKRIYQTLTKHCCRMEVKCRLHASLPACAADCWLTVFVFPRPEKTRGSWEGGFERHTSFLEAPGAIVPYGRLFHVG